MSSLSQVANFAALFLWLEKKIGGLGKRELAVPALKAMAAAALMGGVLLWLRPLVDVAGAPFGRQAAGLAGAIALGIALYFLFFLVLSPKDARELTAAVLHAARPAGRKEDR